MGDEVTASREFILSSVKSGASLETLGLPAGLTVTVQLVTSKSSAKKRQRYARVKLTGGSSAEIPVPTLTTTLETRGPNAELSGSVSASLRVLPAGKTAYRSTKSVQVSTLTYAQLCGTVTLEGITPLSLWEVCEAGSGPLPTLEATRAALEPLAVALVPTPTPEHSGWTWNAPSGVDPTPYLETVPFKAWLARQPQTPALTAFALEMQRQFKDLSVYLDELPCNNCHHFTTAVIGRALWGWGGFTSSTFWDS